MSIDLHTVRLLSSTPFCIARARYTARHILWVASSQRARTFSVARWLGSVAVFFLFVASLLFRLLMMLWMRWFFQIVHDVELYIQVCFSMTQLKPKYAESENDRNIASGTSANRMLGLNALPGFGNIKHWFVSVYLYFGTRMRTTSDWDWEIKLRESLALAFQRWTINYSESVRQ